MQRSELVNDHSRERRSPENFHPPRIPIESMDGNGEAVEDENSRFSNRIVTKRKLIIEAKDSNESIGA